jgi:uncharacterized protein YdaU (DUF1376 family)
MADLTRFDFHAMRFMHSEDVRTMSAEEVGQYVLLLCEAWLTGKDASLPEDKKSLAVLARTNTVSPKVMKKFELVETPWGNRFRNETLYAEWQRAQERSDNGKKAVTERWDRERERGVIQSQYERNTDVSSSYYPNQAKPINPDQTNTTQHETGNFSNLAVRYRRAFGAKLGRGKKTQERYAQACREFSEDAVLKAFDGWAANSTWIREKYETGEMYSDGLKSFYENLADLVNEDMVFEQETATAQEAQAHQEDAIARSLEAGRAEFLEREKQILQEQQETEQAAQGMKALLG